MVRRSKYWCVLIPAVVSNLLAHGLRELLGVVEDQRHFGAPSMHATSVNCAGLCGPISTSGADDGGLSAVCIIQYSGVLSRALASLGPATGGHGQFKSLVAYSNCST